MQHFEEKKENEKKKKRGRYSENDERNKMEEKEIERREQGKSFVVFFVYLYSSRKNVTRLKLTCFWKGQRARTSVPGICSCMAFLF
jgi:hypothetical protein